MEKFLTLDMLLNLPEKVLDITKNPNNYYITMIDTATCVKYYYTNLKKDLLNLFKKFNETKYSFNSYNIKNITNYEITENKKLKNVNNKVEKFIENKIESENLTLEIYNRVCTLSQKLTFNEAIYFVNTFFARLSEEAISEKIGISRTYLQRIKKSCLVKMFFEFSDLIND